MQSQLDMVGSLADLGRLFRACCTMHEVLARGRLRVGRGEVLDGGFA
jgi:hypothetical protein